MSPAQQGFIVLPALGLLVWGLYAAWRDFCRLRALADTPTARIRSAPQGYVELAGRAALMDGEPVLGPLSGLPCAWYRYQVEEKDDRDRWRVVDRGLSEALFWLEDGSGRCVVDPDGAEVIKTRKDVWYEQGPRRGEGWGGLLKGALRGFQARYRYTEQRIAAGDELHVLGRFRTEGGPPDPPDYRRETARLLEDWKRDARRMALFDRNGDGRIDEAEWEAARLAARRQVDRAHLQQAVAPEVHTLSDPGDGRPYLISTVSERRLLRGLRLRAAGWLLAALGAGGWLEWALG